MSRLSTKHESLDAEGKGLCSVPMFSIGGPAGFCEKTAYGNRPKARDIVRWDGFVYREDGLWAGYMSGLACPDHGGPRTRVFQDGNQWCAVHPDFSSLQESPAGFGDTPELARAGLAKAVKA